MNPAHPDSRADLECSERHRLRAETLVSFALEIGGSVELSDLATKFTARAMKLAGARCGFLVLIKDGRAQTVVFHPETVRQLSFHRLNRAVEALIARSSAKGIVLAADRFDLQLAQEQGWRQLIVT